MRASRQQWAELAARLLAEGLAADYEHARRKARGQLDAPLRREDAPRDEEILAALQQHRALYGSSGPDLSAGQRQAEVRAAVQALSAFDPRVVLADLEAAPGPVRILLQAEHPDAVATRLRELGIPARQGSQRLRFPEVHDCEAWEFIAGDLPFRLILRPAALGHRMPVETDGRRWRTLDAAGLANAVT